MIIRRRRSRSTGRRSTPASTRVLTTFAPNLQVALAFNQRSTLIYGATPQLCICEPYRGILGPIGLAVIKGLGRPKGDNDLRASRRPGRAHAVCKHHSWCCYAAQCACSASTRNWWGPTTRPDWVAQRPVVRGRGPRFAVLSALVLARLEAGRSRAQAQWVCAAQRSALCICATFGGPIGVRTNTKGRGKRRPPRRGVGITKALATTRPEQPI